LQLRIVSLLPPRPDNPASLTFSGFARRIGEMHRREHLLELRLGQAPQQAHAPQLARRKASGLKLGLEVQPLAQASADALASLETFKTVPGRLNVLPGFLHSRRVLSDRLLGLRDQFLVAFDDARAAVAQRFPKPLVIAEAGAPESALGR
jgi:hypothetical protein